MRFSNRPDASIFKEQLSKKDGNLRIKTQITAWNLFPAYSSYLPWTYSKPSVSCCSVRLLASAFRYLLFSRRFFSACARERTPRMKQLNA